MSAPGQPVRLIADLCCDDDLKRVGKQASQFGQQLAGAANRASGQGGWRGDGKWSRCWRRRFLPGFGSAFKQTGSFGFGAIERPRFDQALQSGEQDFAVFCGAGENVLKRFTFAGGGQVGLLGFPLAKEFGNQVAPAQLRFGTLLLDEFNQGFFVFLPVCSFEGLGKLPGKTLLNRGFSGQREQERLEFSLGKDCSRLLGDAGNFVVNGSVILGRRRNAPQHQLLKGFAGDYSGVGNRCHGLW